MSLSIRFFNALVTQDFLFCFPSVNEEARLLFLKTYKQIACLERTSREASQDIFVLPFTEGLYRIHSPALT